MLKRLLPLVVLLMVPRSAFSAIAFVQAANNQTGSVTSVSATMTSGTTAHNLLVAFCKAGASSSATFTVTDSASNSYTATTAGIVRNGTDASEMFYVANSTAIATNGTVTCSWGVSATIAIVVYEVSGIASSSPLNKDVSNTQSVSTGTVTSGSLTTTKANCILLLGIGLNVGSAGWTAGGSYTFPANSTNGSTGRGAVEYLIVSSVQSGVTATATIVQGGTVNNMTVFAAFSDTANGSTKPANQFPRVQ